MSRDPKEQVSAAAALGLCLQLIWSITSTGLQLTDSFFRGPACLELVGRRRASHGCYLQTSRLKPKLDRSLRRVTYPEVYREASFSVGCIVLIPATAWGSATLSGTMKSFLSREMGNVHGTRGCLNLLHFQNWPECFSASPALPLHTHWGNFSPWYKLLGY